MKTKNIIVIRCEQSFNAVLEYLKQCQVFMLAFDVKLTSVKNVSMIIHILLFHLLLQTISIFQTLFKTSYCNRTIYLFMIGSFECIEMHLSKKKFKRYLFNNFMIIK